MIAGSASPGPAAWANSLLRGLIVGFPPTVPPVAHDGLRGREAIATTSTDLSFAAQTITRTVGSFIDDGWLPGMTGTVAGSASNDGSYASVASVSALALTFTKGFAFATEGPTLDVQLTGQTPDTFALYLGSQHLNRWTGADVAVIVPAEGLEGDFVATPMNRDPRQIGQYKMIFEIHIWAAEAEATAEELRSIWHDVEHLNGAIAIFENIMRVVKVLSRTPGYNLDGFTWNNDTEVLRYGEALVARVAVGSFPIYDFAYTPLVPAAFTSSATVLQPGESAP